MAVDICVDHPSAFWNQKRHIVTLPHEENFSEDDIPTKSRPCQMNAELVEFCKKEIDNLLQRGLIKPSKSPWYCYAFYVNNVVEKERVVPRMDPSWATKGRGRGKGGRSSSSSGRSYSQGSSYGSSSNSPAYLAAKKHSDTFALVAKEEDTDDIRSYEKLMNKEMIFLLENSEIQRKNEPWKIF
uniref:Uncharacterized protein LOC104214626 n=1 Tax=Nicotiana sylvestris TaxID=4096 RepID=A0A1U7VLA3_NICSY|nr:PREDICTED: uncharacterized protein LOC104214626 [Nicotiana sylvestris]